MKTIIRNMQYALKTGLISLPYIIMLIKEIGDAIVLMLTFEIEDCNN